MIYVHEIIIFRHSCMFRHTVVPTTESPRIGNAQEANLGLVMMAKLHDATRRSHKMS